MHLSSLSEDLYQYLKSYYHHNAVKPKFYEFWLEDIFDRTEPVPVYTNIENGYGIFGGYSTSVDSISTTNVNFDYFYYYD